MKTVVFYHRADVPMEKIMEVYPRHKALCDVFVKENKVIGIGAFADHAENTSDDLSSMGIFTDRKSAEDFMKQDPFMLEGLVSKFTMKEWNDSVLP